MAVAGRAKAHARTMRDFMDTPSLNEMRRRCTRVRAGRSLRRRDQILRTVIFAVSSPGGEWLSGASSREAGIVWTGAGSRVIQEEIAQWISMDGAVETICGCAFVRSSVWQQPVFAI